MPITVVVRSGAGNEPALTFDGMQRVVIGRGAGCDVRLPDPSVSHRHASLHADGAEFLLTDEGGTNGTYVGDVRIAPHTSRIVRSGDAVRLGRVWLELRLDHQPATRDLALATREIALAIVARAMSRDGQATVPRVLVAEGPDRGAAFSLGEAGRAYVIGRGPECDVLLADRDASPEHATCGPPRHGVVLAVLMARDVVHSALLDKTQASIEVVLTLTQLDNRLKQHAAAITQGISLADWRDSFHPPPESWWWFLSPPTPPQRWNRFDWLWNTLSVICLTLALSVVVDISGRFLQGGPDTWGAFAVIGQSVLTMLAAGGALTQAGREVSERILTSLRLPKYFWSEVQLSFAVLLLVGSMLFSYALPWIASLYNNRGVEHYTAGRLGSAESAFNRALKLNPDAVGAHYNLGRLYETLEEDDRARAEYKTALKGGLDAAYNNLARLYLVQEQYAQAEPLLLAGIGHTQDDDVKYSILKNLG